MVRHSAVTGGIGWNFCRCTGVTSTGNEGSKICKISQTFCESGCNLSNFSVRIGRGLFLGGCRISQTAGSGLYFMLKQELGRVFFQQDGITYISQEIWQNWLNSSGLVGDGIVETCCRSGYIH